METKKILLIAGIIILAAALGFYWYLNALGSAWTLNKSDDSPYFVTSDPIIVKKISLPKGTKITYKKPYFWKKSEQGKLLDEKDITQIRFQEGVTIDWGGVPITSIVKFNNAEMKGFSVSADFDKLDESIKTQFSISWLSCNKKLGIAVENTDDWSFNKTNILDVQSCGVNYQRHFKEDEKQQLFLDDLYRELMKVKN